MRFWIALAAVLFLLTASPGLQAAPALQSRELQFGPVPAWVKPVPIPDAGPNPGGSIQILLLNSQTFYGGAREERYSETAMKVLNAQGLRELGNIGQTWDPLVQTMTIHRAELIRNGEVIDLLADDQSFRIVQRETDMAQDILNGRVSAIKEIRGLRVGDIIHLVSSSTYRDSVRGGVTEGWDTLAHPGVAERVVIRHVWPRGKAVRWRSTDGLEGVRLTQTATESELLYDHTKVETPVPPQDAPARFNTLGEVELTEFADWKDVSKLFAPIFRQASTLSANSPLKAEADKIRRAYAKPEDRAAAALRLVEEEVRYLALTMGEGGLTPAEADLTWTRRFGDCKGKTALLIALLTELGIKAEPALANSFVGDALDERLPRIGAFNHVIVRAEINGRVYWLDGTRNGDRSLATMPDPALGWVLPVRAAGSGLERIQIRQPPAPLVELLTEIDARNGIDSMGPAVVQVLFRGDEGLAMEQAFGSVSRQETEKFLREKWAEGLAWMTVDKITFGYDEAESAMRIRFEGRGRLAWRSVAGVRQTSFGSSFTTEYVERPAGPYASLPVALSYPHYAVDTTRIRLPGDGAGFVLDGADVDTTVGGMSIKRSSRIAGGDAVVVMTTRTTQAELPMKDALASVVAFNQLPTARDVVLRAPRGAASARGAGSAVTGTPTTAREFAVRASQLFGQNKPDEALAAVDQGVAIDAGYVQLHILRATILASQERFDLAAVSARKAVELAPGTPGPEIVLADILLELRQPEEALALSQTALARTANLPAANLNRARSLVMLGRVEDMIKAEDAWLAAIPGRDSDSMELGMVSQTIGNLPEPARIKAMAALASSPNSAVARTLRGLLYVESDLKAAVEQYDAALRLKPDFLHVLRLRGIANLAANEPGRALADYDRLIRLKPTEANLFSTRANLYQTLGRMEEALLDYDEAVRLAPANPLILNNRCWFRAITNVDLEKALKDCDDSLELRPNDAATLDSRGFVHFRLKRYEQALKDYDEALRIRPDSAESHYGRALVRRARGDRIGADADMAEATRLKADIAAEFAGYGIQPAS